MNKKITIITALLISSVSAFSQIGFKAGVVSVKPKVTFEDISFSGKSSIGFNVGAYYNLPISEKFSVQPELNLVINNSNKSTDMESPYKQMFLMIPVYGKMAVTEKLSIFLGPQIDYLLKYSSEGEDATSELKKLGFSGAAGAEYQIMEGLNVGLRYSTQVAGYANKDDTYGKASIKNNVIGLTITKSLGTN